MLRIPSKAPAQLPPHPYTFPLDPFQQHAIHAISNDENVLICAKTGSGKTLVGEYQIFHSLSKGKRVFYTTPIKSLSNQKFYDLKHQFKDKTVGIMTGDIKFCPDAQIIVMTTEILRNLLYKKDTSTAHLGITATLSIDDVDAVVFDECHYINDADRGKIWEETIILLPPHINMVMLSATLANPEGLASWIGDLKKKPIHLIETHYRIVPLTHNLLDENYKLVPLMDAKEVYHEKVYEEWLQVQKQIIRQSRNVKEEKQEKEEKDKHKTEDPHSFIYRVNEAVKMLNKKELLPALFFILSRKQCETYAHKIETCLLSSSDISAVKHTIKFHLHHHMDELEKTPQYHQIYHLLCRGLAFHHSGLLPILKEIVEILFSKGFVRLLFCTETFAVGLNMPTKTVIFSGFKKYDETIEDMRILRHDEYIQMAGRAGRRGKDDKGVVIYLPERDPLTATEMYKMCKGSKTPVLSKMDFHYDFILKTIQSAGNWVEIMEKSHWFQQQQKEVRAVQTEMEQITKKIGAVEIVEPYFSSCEKRFDLEKKIKTATNAEKKELQSKLSSLKNSHLGPKWNKALADYVLLQNLKCEYEKKKADLYAVENYKEGVEAVIAFLTHIEYINEDGTTLTLKGTLATEINEGHQILMTELYFDHSFKALSGDEIVSVLTCFLEKNRGIEDTATMNSLSIQKMIKTMDKWCDKFKCIEGRFESHIEGYWNLSQILINPFQEWMDGEPLSVICVKYELFEGNFIRSVLKVSNMLDELISMGSYCQDIEFVEKITEVRSRITNGMIVSDSLYLRL
jgi:superfamily II RNA helicase